MGDPELLPRVVYEDEALVAVEKPARMHSAPGEGSGDLCAWVFERFPDAALLGSDTAEAGTRSGGHRSPGEGGLLHRLDYETSGLVLFARSLESFEAILRQQEAGGFNKEYLAFSTVSAASSPPGSRPPRAFPRGLDGAAWDRARGRLDGGALAALLRAAAPGGLGISSLFRPYGPRGSRVACLSPAQATGRAAEAAGPTYSSEIHSCEEDGPGGPGALGVRMRLARGFRHQVRAHLAWIGLPISGDLLYGGARDERLRLYAVGLSFAHPLTGAAMHLSVGEP